MTVDWSIGHYETTAEQLLPAARAAVDVADVRPGERVVDVGCGTGNAALLAAERGAVVVGVDPAARLLDVARTREQQRGLTVDFALGDAAHLPLPDASAEVILSVFAVIFVPDPAAALAEMARVVTGSGRLVVTAWLPGGAIGRMTMVEREAVQAALGVPSDGPGLAWHDVGAVAELASTYGFAVTAVEHSLVFTAASPTAYVDEGARNHPMAIASRRLLDQRGDSDAVRERMIAVLEEDNEDPAGFRVTSRYVVLTLTRS